MGRKSKIKKDRRARRRFDEARKDDPVEITLSLPYFVRSEQRVDVFTNGSTKPSIWSEDRKITDELIRTALRARYEGTDVDPTIRKMNGKIQKIVGQATAEKKDRAALSREQFDHVRRTLADWKKCPTDFHTWLDDLEEHLSEVDRAEKDREKAEAVTKDSAKNGSSEPREPAKVGA